MSDRRRTGAAEHRRKKKYRVKKRFFVFLLILVLCLVGMVRCAAGWLEGEEKEMKKPTKEMGNNVEENGASSGISRTAIASTEPWKLTLVNKSHKLPEDFTVETTVIAGEEQSGRSFDSRAVDSLNRMLADSKAAGLDVVVCSAHRTLEYQKKLISNQVERYVSRGMSQAEAEAKTAREIIEPGASEHNLGLAVDLVARSYQELEPEQADTPENQWLLANCTKYGFILRYPEDKQEITEIIYEPWHFRYVGEAAAKEIMEQNLCLEEYLGETSSQEKIAE